jgi:hypothetical protein
VPNGWLTLSLNDPDHAERQARRAELNTPALR